jgi:hypothetical protein
MTTPNAPSGAVGYVAPGQTAPQLPSALEVNLIHTKDDVDGGQQSHHHTIGPGRNQTASGFHVHDGSNGRLVGKDLGLALTGLKVPATVADCNVLINSLYNALAKVMDLRDART